MLTSVQLATLKAAIAGTPAWNSQPQGSDGAYAIAALMNASATPAFYVWASAVPVEDIYDAVVWANLTPSQPQDGTQAWANRALMCQGKQFNLQTILLGRIAISGAKVNTRAGLQDALSAVPSGATGNNQSAGWTAVQNALSRRATWFEKLFADTSLGDGSTRALSATLVLESPVSYQDVQAARES